ncbi:DUF3068 domain-containing protein [Spiractinospora alimapuensis]|uniref:DUF3068 domain-containing protein n=1 Tax=Spiractinospora alimapuensis TaxID=2820884 RepID=UPI001F1D8E45
MLRFWVANEMMRTPMDYYAEVTHEAVDATYFNIEDVEVVEDATVHAYTTLRADVAASSPEDEVVVWDQFTWIEDAQTGYGISSNTRRVGHDRLTGEAVDGYDAAINESPVVQAGQAYKFPFLPEQRSYDFYDTTSQQSAPMEFDGVETVEGTHEGSPWHVDAYRYVQRIDEIAIDERDVPADLLDIEVDEDDEDAPTDVETDEIFEITRTYWIDPVTGTPLKQREEQSRVARAETGEELVLLDADLEWTQETTDSYYENARRGMTMIPLLRETLPLTFLVLGGVLILSGVPLYVLRGRSTDLRQ